MADDLASISRRLAALNEELSAVSTGLQRLLGISEAPPAANPTPRPARRRANGTRAAEDDERMLQKLSTEPATVSGLAKTLTLSRAATLARLNRLATAGRVMRDESGKWTTLAAT
jgi:hypothetical protein